MTCRKYFYPLILCLFLLFGPFLAAGPQVSLGRQFSAAEVDVGSTWLEFIKILVGDMQTADALNLNWVGVDFYDLDREDSVPGFSTENHSFLDRYADLLISQFHPQIQSSLREAYYYNSGLERDFVDEKKYAHSEIDFGMVQLISTSGSSQDVKFKIGWPGYMSYAPNLNRIIKTEQVVIEYGLALTAAMQGKFTTATNENREANMKRVQLLAEVYKSAYWEVVNQVIPQKTFELEVQNLEKFDVPEDQRKKLKSYLGFRFKSRVMLLTRLMQIIEADPQIVMGSSALLSQIKVELEKIYKTRASRPEGDEWIGIHQRLLEYSTALIQTNIEFERSKLRSIEDMINYDKVYHEAATKVGDILYLEALRRIDERPSIKSKSCPGSLVH